MSLAAIAALVATVGTYLAVERFDRRFRAPWTTPVGLSVVVLASWLAWGSQWGQQWGLPWLDVDLDAYRRGTRPLTAALGPGVVALGWLAYQHRGALLRSRRSLITGVVAGTVTSLASTSALAVLLGARPLLAKALGLKSVTSPVAFEVARGVGVDPALTVPFVIAAGIIGAVIGPAVLRLVPARWHASVGIAVGTASHGIGTAGLAGRGHTREAALSALAMAASAIATSALAPIAFQWIDGWIGS